MSSYSPFTHRQHENYFAGKKARNNGESLTANPMLAQDPFHTFWQCGWHDADMEAGVRIYRGPSANQTRMLLPASKCNANLSTQKEAA